MMDLLAWHIGGQLLSFTLVDANQTSPSPPSNEEEDEPLGTSLGIFAGNLFGSMAILFILIGACILTHTVYMRCFKKEKYVIES